MYDVAVIGGGPAGSRTAYRLAEYGYRVLVLEEKESAGAGVCCTGVIGGECVQLADVGEDVILSSTNSARAFSPSGRMIRLSLPETQAYIVDRRAFDAGLARRTQEKGAEYRFNTRVIGIETRDDGAIIRALAEGKYLSIAARVAVIAAGFSSPLLEEIGMGKIDFYALGAQALVDTVGIDEVEIYFGNRIAPGFFAWLVPVSSGKARLGLLVRENPGFYLKRLISRLLEEGKIASDNAAVRYGGVSLKPLPRTYGNRVLVVGTAAGQVKPTTGGGIYYGLLCADMAAENLHRALSQNDLSSGRLAGYQREWRKRLGRELGKGYRARRLYQRLSDREIDGMFRGIASNGMLDHLLKADDVSFDWHGGGLLRMMGRLTISRAARMVRAPFRKSG
ncbi:MAG: NAD(P)/FAD-dependent oxidoreductase [Dehalococcoidales bacterium]